MDNQKLFAMAFSAVYPLYVKKAERKGRTKEELDAVLCWLTGYDSAALAGRAASGCSLAAFFADAPRLNPARSLVKGTVCGVRVEAIDDPLLREIRVMDKLVDELAKGRPLEKILNR